MMPPTRIIDVLAEVFRTHGFDTTSPAHPEDAAGRTHRVDLLAEKAGLDVMITTSTTPERIVPLMEEQARARDAIGAQYALVAAMHPLEDTHRQSAERHSVIAWDSDQVASAIGRAVLMEVADARDPGVAELLSLAPIGALQVEPAALQIPASHHEEEVDPLPFADLIHPDAMQPAQPMAMDNPTASLTPDPAPNVPTLPERNVETGRGWFLETKAAPALPPVSPQPATLHAPGARTGIPGNTGRDPHTFTPTTGALLAPTIGKEHAATIARSETFTIDNTRLLYHPKRLFEWQVEAFVEGQVKTHLIKGRCLVDMATKRLEVPHEWDAPRHLREGTFDVVVDHKPIRMENAHAHELVMAHVVDQTAREATMQDDDSAGDYALTVKRRVRVQKEDVQVQDNGLHWCPVWWISGKNGEIEVDGLSGQVREKRLQNPPSETILL